MIYVQTVLLTIIAFCALYYLFRERGEDIRGQGFWVKPEHGGFNGRIVRHRKILNRYWILAETKKHGEIWIPFEHLKSIEP